MTFRTCLHRRLSRAVVVIVLCTGAATSAADPEEHAAATAPVASCPHVGTLDRPDRLRFDNVQVRESNASELCWKSVAPGIRISWPYATSDLDSTAVAALVARTEDVIRRAAGVYSALLPQPQTTTVAAATRRGDIVIGLYPAIEDDGTDLGGFHYFDEGAGDSLIYLTADPAARMRDTDTRWVDVIEHTAAHELFHAVQRQLAGHALASTEPWVGEALADWGAKLVNRGEGPWLDDGRFLYHRAIERFFQQVSLGLRTTAYSAHLFWHWYASERGLESIRDVLEHHARTGSEAQLIEHLDFPLWWHTFARTLVNRGPWQLVADMPAYPAQWSLPIDSIIDRSTTRSVQLESHLYPLSARRYRIDPRPDDVGLRLEWSSPAPGLVRASALLLPEGREVELEIGINDFCLDPRRGCVSRPESIELIISNADSEVARVATLRVLDIR